MPDISNSIMTPIGKEDTSYSLKPFAEHGFTMLWLSVRNGRRFMLKGLTQAYRDKPEFRQLLRKEFELLLSLDSESVVKAWALEESEKTGLCIVMEYAQGSTLAEYLKSHTATPREKLDIAIELAQALAYIHSRGISHRDLKPDNIIVNHERKRLKIIDFGLGDGSDFITYKQSGATRTYGAPEQLNDSTGDSRSDVYSFGVILREMSIASAVARRCRRVNPAERPTMEQVVKALKSKQTGLQKYAIAAIIAVALLSVGVNLYLLLTPGTPATQPTVAPAVPDKVVKVDSTADLRQHAAEVAQRDETPISAPPVQPPELPAEERASTVITVDNYGDSLFEDTCEKARKIVDANKQKIGPDFDNFQKLEIYNQQNVELKGLVASFIDNLKSYGLRQSAITQYESSFWYHVTMLINEAFFN